MDPLVLIRALEGVPIAAVAASAWGPHDTVSVGNVASAAGVITFDLLVPTIESDIWDYIWSSEREKDTTEKVQLFQGGSRVAGSHITAIRREGESDRWDAKGPERYRLTFQVPASAIKAAPALQVRFFWNDTLMSSAG